MLILTRKEGSRVKIGDKIWLTVIQIGRGKVRIGIDAPAGVVILREELIRSQEQSQDQKGEDDAAR